MPPLTNNRRELFCLALIQGVTQREAAIRAGYAPTRAYQTSHELVINSDIINRIVELNAQVKTDAIMSARERKETLSEIARGRITDFVETTETGHNINIGLEGAHSAALREVKTETKFQVRHGKAPEVITELKLNDPVRAIAELNRMEGDYAPEQRVLKGVVLLKIVEDEDNDNARDGRGDAGSPTAIQSPH